MANNPSQHRCVFVGNIPYDASEEQLIQICEEVGPVVSFRLVIDRETGKPKGYGFCEYKDEETALSARRNLQGYEINGRQLRVDFAENDKGSDRNREQGRGGPGLTSNTDAQKSSGGPAILGDSALYQPIGLPLSSTAASVMAGALGSVQADSMRSMQNGLQSQSGLASDPLTLYLAKMSRKQLYDIMSEMKVMTTQNRELARQLFSLCPLLLKALFQAQIMLGMVSPQVLQMSNIRQSPSSVLQPPTQDGVQDLKLAGLPPIPVQSSLAQNKTQLGMIPSLHEPQNASRNNQHSVLPFQQAPTQPRIQHPQQAQNQPFPQTMPSQPGVLTVPSVRPLTNSQPPALESSSAPKQQMQAPLLHNPRPVGAANNTQNVFPHATHHSLIPRPLLSQPNFQQQPGSSNSMTTFGLPEIGNNNFEKSSEVTNETRWVPGSNSNLHLGVPGQTGMTRNNMEPTRHPSKLAKLEDGRSAMRTMVSQNTNTASESGPSPEMLQNSNDQMLQNSNDQMLQLAPEVQSALLEQVKSLTPEQLRSLPPEQRQQVIDLQKMLR